MNALRKEAQLAICPPTHSLMDVPDEVGSYHNRIFSYQLASILCNEYKIRASSFNINII